MLINIRNSWEPAASNVDLKVFIDVFRTSTTILYLLHSGVNDLVVVHKLKQINNFIRKGYQVVSEIAQGAIDNSPSLVLNYTFIGRPTIIFSGNFTEAVFFNNIEPFSIVASYANIDIIANFIKENRFSIIDIIACSHFSEKLEAIEDISCAIAIRKLIEGRNFKRYPYINLVLEKIRKRKLQKGLFPTNYWADIDLALVRNSIPIIPIFSKISDELYRIETYSNSCY